MFKFFSNKKKDSSNTADNIDEKVLSSSIDTNLTFFQQFYFNDGTLKTRSFENLNNNGKRFCILYFNGMIDDVIINDSILKPMMVFDTKCDTADIELLVFLKERVIQADEVNETNSFLKCIDALTLGDCLLLIDGSNKALLINSKGWKSRAITPSDEEKGLRGPKESFIESLIVNTTLIRRKIKSPNLRFEFLELGSKTRTQCSLCYINGITSPIILNELKKRLGQIDIDGVLDSGIIQEWIHDSPYSPFMTIGSFDRPDLIAGKLLEGRIGILVDGSPIVITVPFIFIEYFQTGDDYYLNFLYASLGRMSRMLGSFLTLSVPAVYLAIITYHQELIPTPLLLSIYSLRQDIPFPSIVEILIMLSVFEIIREASIRMPNTLGQSLTIVGGLVLGQATVDARLISAPVVIIVALTGMSSLMIPKMQYSIIFFRTILILLVSILGLVWLYNRHYWYVYTFIQYEIFWGSIYVQYQYFEFE